MKPLLGQIIRLTKSIHLSPPLGADGPSLQFIAGKSGRNAFSGGGIGVTWWYDQDTFEALDSVASLFVEYSEDFRDCDRKTIKDCIVESLKMASTDKEIFLPNVAGLFGDGSLFDCRAGPPLQFSASLLRRFDVTVRSNIGQLCIAYALPRFKCLSFHIQSEGIRVVARSDTSAWDLLAKSGYGFGGWTPQSPIIGSRPDKTFSPGDRFDSLIVAEGRGTRAGVKFDGVLRFRKMTAVLVAVASSHSKYPFLRSAANPLTFCIQFPHKSASTRDIVRSDCDPIVPYYVTDVIIGPGEVEEVTYWYAALADCNTTTQSKISKAAHFVNRAMNASDIESFVNYFVALDALFGERGSVEPSILRGVATVLKNDDLVDRVRWLFDLRSELVHGGSRFLEEWPKYRRYVDHFGEEPGKDVASIALMTILRAPAALQSR